MPGPYDYTVPGAQPITAGLQGLQGGLQIAQQAQQMQAAQQKQQRQQQYRQDSYALSQNPNATAQDYVDLQAQYPEFAEGIKALNSARSDAQVQGDLNVFQKVNAAISANKPEQAVSFLREYSTALKNSGREDEAQQATSIADAAEVDPQSVKAATMNMLLGIMGPEEFLKSYQQEQRTITDRQPYTVKSEIYPDGTLLQVMNVGPPIITAPNGRQLQGEEAAQAIMKAQEYGSTLAKNINYNRSKGTLEGQKGLKAEITAEVKSAENAEKTRQEFFGQYEKIQNNIRTLDEGIALIEKGIAEGKDLGVGPIRRYFPTWGTTANQLKNVANRMGLDVVSSVTFGALSESELKMAMQTAMPTNLRGQALLDWMKSRKAAQEKLADYLSQAANFIGSQKEDGGVNTATDWMQVAQGRKQRTTERIIQPEQPTGGNRKSQLFNRLMEIQRSKGK